MFNCKLKICFIKKIEIIIHKIYILQLKQQKMNFLANFKGCNTSEEYKQLVDAVKNYGIENFKNELVNRGYIDGDILTCEDKPFNPFTRIITGKMVPLYGNLLEQVGMNSDNFFIIKNLPEYEMSKRHQFLLIKSLRWSTFNVLTFGLDPDFDTTKCIKLLDEMEKIAIEYTRKCGWSNNIGLYFHCYPFNSVQSLHMHILDLDVIGPTYHKQCYKNLSVQDVRAALMERISQ